MVSANEIPPGQEGQITVSVKTGVSRRQIRQVVRVFTNIPGTDQIDIILTANVLVDVEVLQPSILRFDSRQSLPHVTVKNYTDMPVEIVKLVPPSEHVRLSVSATVLPPRGTVVVYAELDAETPRGVLSDWARLHTNLPSLPVVSIRVWANLQQDPES